MASLRITSLWLAIKEGARKCLTQQKRVAVWYQVEYRRLSENIIAMKSQTNPIHLNQYLLAIVESRWGPACGMLTSMSQLGMLRLGVNQSPKCAAQQGVKRRQSCLKATRATKHASLHQLSWSPSPILFRHSVSLFTRPPKTNQFLHLLWSELRLSDL